VDFLSAPSNFLAQRFRNSESKDLGPRFPSPWFSCIPPSVSHRRVASWLIDWRMSVWWSSFDCGSPATQLYICIYLCMDTYMYIYISLSIHICIYIYCNTYIYIYIHVYTQINEHIHIYIQYLGKSSNSTVKSQAPEIRDPNLMALKGPQPLLVTSEKLDSSDTGHAQLGV